MARPVDPEVARIRSRIATKSHYHPGDDVTADREALERAKTTAHIAALVASAPPLRADQIERLRGLLADVPVIVRGGDQQ